MNYEPPSDDELHRRAQVAWARAGIKPSLSTEDAITALTEQRDKAIARVAELEQPIPLILYCPMCHARHVDEGSQATTPHRTHACQNPRCGHLWAPAVVATVGVWTLPGCLNPVESPEKTHTHDWRSLNSSVGFEACWGCTAERIFDVVRGWRYRADPTSAWVGSLESALTRSK